MQIRAYIPTEPKYKGRDAAAIIEIGGMYVPFYLSAGIDGLRQAAESDSRKLAVFNEINPDFFRDYVCPLADDIEERGLEALKQYGIGV